MKKLISGFMTAAIAVAFLSFTVTSCKNGPKDADVQAAAQTTLSAITPAATVTVEKGVATISGEVADDATKASLEAAASKVEGVKSVVNSLTVAPPPPAPTVEITADSPLNDALKDALKDSPSVTYTVKDGVVTLTGEITKANLPTLMQKINALKPKKIENQLTIK